MRFFEKSNEIKKVQRRNVAQKSNEIKKVQDRNATHRNKQ